ncbi:MAG: nucleoside monophosphate kinase [Halobacteriovoraceae bacterium]|jgi:adenylate kinase|nr:nucleoside monophosphate kinase [Halobacteriovoraceae bacterium]
MKNLILLGSPGSGKGTQSAKLVSLMSYTHVSTGNLLREEILKESELGVKIKKVMESGGLVSDDLVVELLRKNLSLSDKAYIFDGYPRNIEQAKTLANILEESDFLAVFLKLDTDDLVERLKHRRVTRDGKYIYNLESNPPKVDGVCDVTGEELVQRDDDKEDIVRNRMKVFKETISPVLSLYRGQGKLVEIDANRNLEDVYNSLIECI